MQTAGFVLAGGLSKRMGRDKAKLPVDSEPLIKQICKRVAAAAGDVCIVGPRYRYEDLGFEVIEDLRASLGPLAGIEAALASQRGDLNLIVACDMPDIETNWLAHLLNEAAGRDAACCVTGDMEGNLHPLCSVWLPRCLPLIRRALDERRLRVHDLLDELGANTVTTSQRFSNVNTPAEWAAWQLTR